MIVEKTYELFKKYHKQLTDTLILSDVRIGLLLTAVRLSDGSCGVASTLSDYNIHCGKADRDFGEFTPSKIIGQRVSDLFETSKRSNLIDSLRVAVLNALSSGILSASNYKIIENTDPVDLLDLKESHYVTIVGGFNSYIRRIAETGVTLSVLELDEAVLSPEHRKYFVHAEDYHRILPLSDIIIITGFTLVNNTIEGLLASAAKDSTVIVTGPSCSIMPDILFANGVKMIGATRITDPDKLFSIAGEGGAGYHLFRYCAQKICIINEK